MLIILLGVTWEEGNIFFIGGCIEIILPCPLLTASKITMLIIALTSVSTASNAVATAVITTVIAVININIVNIILFTIVMIVILCDGIYSNHPVHEPNVLGNLTPREACNQVLNPKEP